MANKIIKSGKDYLYFHYDEFDDPNQIETIISEIPDYKKYLKNKKKTQKDAKYLREEVLFKLACCIEPSLSNEQLSHLFRKFNYYKMILSKLKIEKNINYYKNKVLEIKQKIALSNSRLILRPLFGRIKYKEELGDVFNVLFVKLLYVIDRFNPFLGYKFSTYFVNAAHYKISSYLREIAVLKTRNKLCENLDKNISNFNSFTHSEKTEIKENLYHLLDNYRDQRTKDIICKSFGINCNKMTNKNIGKIYGVSPQRIDQLKQITLENLNKKSIEIELVV